MSTRVTSEAYHAPAPHTPSPPPRSNGFARDAMLFVGFGLLLYLFLFIGSERLAAGEAFRNRFHVVRTLPSQQFDYLILGASHAAVFDYRDMNAQLERLTGARVLNLAEVGAGISVNQLFLEYFLQRHSANTVVYVLDSFVFYSREWNEERLNDANLFRRAPWDPSLAALLLRQPAARNALVGYVTGFTKINDPERFEADQFAGEGSAFERSYRPIPQLDRQRIEYLYPAGLGATDISRGDYVGDFERMVRDVRERGMRFIIVRPPIPTRIRESLPLEDQFDAFIESLALRVGAELHDFSSAVPDERFYYDSDHLNQEGVLYFFENHLAPLLRSPGSQAPR